jgi:glycine/D-amino acid oxidase-like deaminating enzyme
MMHYPMKQQENNSLWALSRKTIADVNILDHEEKADIAIIGGGFTGTSAALRLASSGINVALVEAKFNGFGGSGSNVGLTNAGLWLNPEKIENCIGKKYADRLNNFLSTAPDLVHSLIEKHNIECDAVRNGSLHLAHSKAGMKYIEERAKQINERGGKVTILDQAQTYKLTAAENYLGAIHDMRAGTIQPLEYCHGLSVAAKKAGARLYTNTPAINVHYQGGKWHIKTPNGKIIAPQVFMATNAYLENILPELKTSFTPLYYSQMATDPLSEEQLKHYLPGKNGTWDTRLVMRSYRTDKAGRLIIGTIGNIFMDNAPLFQSWADKMVKNTFPNIGKVNWTYKWAGRLACSQNHIPNLHDLGSGLYSCSGFSGRGISPGTAFGHAMADFFIGKIDKNEMPLPFTPIKAVPLSIIRELFYETGSQLSRVYDHL